MFFVKHEKYGTLHTAKKLWLLENYGVEAGSVESYAYNAATLAFKKTTMASNKLPSFK